MSEPTTTAYRWTELLRKAVEEPGALLAAYTAFHEYSLGNQIAALFQCAARGITPGPLASFNAWKARNRWVKRGQRAIALCMPITIRRHEVDEESGEETTRSATVFTWKPNWFVLSQTDGETFVPAAIPTWDATTALAALGITEVTFELVDGNTQGYVAGPRQIAVNPLAALPHKTRFHELAHVVLGHDAPAADSEATPRNIAEVEAEAVALLCCDVLGLAGAEYSRGYIQAWGQRHPISETSARRIITAADQILRAGRVS